MLAMLSWNFPSKVVLRTGSKCSATWHPQTGHFQKQESPATLPGNVSSEALGQPGPPSHCSNPNKTNKCRNYFSCWHASARTETAGDARAISGRGLFHSQGGLMQTAPQHFHSKRCDANLITHLFLWDLRWYPQHEFPHAVAQSIRRFPRSSRMHLPPQSYLTDWGPGPPGIPQARRALQKDHGRPNEGGR